MLVLSLSVCVSNERLNPVMADDGDDNRAAKFVTKKGKVSR